MNACIIFPEMRGYYAKVEFWDHTSVGELEMVEISQLQSLLEGYGHTVDNYELFYKNKNEKDFNVIVNKRDYDFFAMYVDYDSMVNVAKMAIKIKKLKPNAIVAIFGYYTILNHKKVLQIIDRADVGIIGLDEKIFVDLFDCIQSGKSYHQIPGLAYKNEKRQIVVNPPSTKYTKFENMPWVKRGEGTQEKVEVRTITGCTSNCIFCEMANARYSINFKDLRIREVEDVVNELEYLVKEKGTKLVRFQDETFLLYSKERTEWLRKFIDLIKERNIKFEFIAQARANDVIKYDELLPELKEVGLTSFFIGIETFLQSKLDFFRKGCTVEQNIKAIEIVRKHKIHTALGYMLFDPFATLDELKENLQQLETNEFYEHILGSGGRYPFPVDSVVGINPANDLYRMVNEYNLVCRDVWFGYHFSDKKAQEYYDICCLWGENCTSINGKVYQTDTTNANGLWETEAGKEYLIVINEIKKINLRKLIELCDLVREDRSEEFYQDFINQWENSKEQLYSKFNALDEVLSNI